MPIDLPAPRRDAEDSHSTKGLLRLTMACNERCPFCNVPMEDYPRVTPTVEETRAQLDAFVATGERTLTISGGEPTLLRKRLVALIAEARSRGVELVELQTNAVLIDADYATELAGAGLTSAFVSLLSHLPELHDELAGLPGAFPRCLEGIDALLAAPIRVALNPVTALQTQHLVPDYVDFVAARLPGVRSISLSAVQPHGRAASGLDLLPDYAVLGPAVREARRRADRHGIDLLNPYCGLPLCVGWEGGLDHSVEAIEAEAARRREAPGVDNVGDKRHGPACARCALRTRCGGAWHAYWDHRGGSGLSALLASCPPWEGPGQGQVVVRRGEAPGPDAPTVWLWCRALEAADLRDVARHGITDVALQLDAVPDRRTLKAVRALLSRNGPLEQRAVRVFVGLTGVTPTTAHALVDLLRALGVAEVAVLGGDPALWGRFAAARTAAHPELPVRHVANPVPGP